MLEAGKWLLMLVEPDAPSAAATRRLLARVMPHWQVEVFSDGYHAASYLLQTELAPQLLLTDSLDDSLSGEDLLEFCAARSPATIRVLMSAQNDDAVMVTAVNSAQMLLGKPFTEQDLLSVMVRTEQVLEGPFPEYTRYQLGGIHALPLQQRQYQQLLSLLNDQDSSLKSIAAALSREAPLAARLLQLANSAYLGFSRQTLELTEVVSRLGREIIKAILYSYQANQQFSGRIQPEVHQRLQDYAQSLATLAHQLAKTQCRDDARLAEKAFIAGLMQSLGPLVLLSMQPPSAQQLTHEDMWRDGIADHCLLTGYLMTLWGFSADVCQAAMYRLDLAASPQPDRLQAVLHLASYVLFLQQADPQHAVVVPAIEALEAFELTHEFLPPLK